MNKENIEYFKQIHPLYYEEILTNFNKKDVKYMYTIYQTCIDMDIAVTDLKMKYQGSNVVEVPQWVIKNKISKQLDNSEIENEMLKYINKKDICNEWEYIWLRIMEIYERNGKKKR